jgi:hypothetical protein
MDGLTHAALYRLITDDNALPKERHMPLKMAVEGIQLFDTKVVLIPASVIILFRLLIPRSNPRT